MHAGEEGVSEGFVSVAKRAGFAFVIYVDVDSKLDFVVVVHFVVDVAVRVAVEVSGSSACSRTG